MNGSVKGLLCVGGQALVPLNDGGELSAKRDAVQLFRNCCAAYRLDHEKAIKITKKSLSAAI
jgi:hypothetical protein